MGSEWILSFGLGIVGFGPARQHVSDDLNIKRFRSHFGIGPKAILSIAKDLHIDLKDKKGHHNELKFLMMALCWLKLYDTEHVMAGRWGFGEEFCRETVKRYVRKLQSLRDDKIRFQVEDRRRIYIGSVDCVHCEVNEFRTAPNSIWYSHKHNGCGLTYEVVMDLCDDRVLWLAGPKPASTHDITFFRGGKTVSKSRNTNEAAWDKGALYFQIPKGKKLIGDSGYKGEPKKVSVTCREHNEEVKEFFARAKSRQETFNGRIKVFEVLDGRFRHGKGVQNKMDLHKMCFEAVCVAVQYDMENGYPLMQI